MINQGFYRSIPTSLDLNGPVLSFIQTPSGISGNIGSTIELVGVATALFPGGIGATTGSILYRWYEQGVGALSDGGRLSGTTTTTLKLTNLQSGDSGRKFYLEARYSPSAYANGKIGRALNEPVYSNVVGAGIELPPRPTASITASSTNIEYNESVTIRWSTTNANTLTSNFGDTRLSGSKTFTNQTSSRSFSITATNENGSTSASTFVAVKSPLNPSVSLSVSPSSIPFNGSTTVTWSSTNATGVVSSNFGATATEINGTTTLTNQTESKTFFITVRNAYGVQRTATASLTVAAAPQPDPPTLTLSASPSSIENGGSTTLTWSTTNATSLSSDFGVTDLSGTLPLTGLVQTRTFTATAFGPGGTSGPKSTTVTVAAPLPVIVITSQPSDANVNEGTFVSFTVGATVDNPTGATLQYQWYVNGTAVSNTIGSIGGANTPTLQISRSAGNYTVFCRLSYSGATTVDSRIANYIVNRVVVIPTISITQQPTNQTASINQNATFTVQGAASDGSAVSYQWFNADGSSIGLTASTITISHGTTGVRSYFARVLHPTASNSPLQSNIVSLTVTAPRNIIRVSGRTDDTTSIGGYTDIDLTTFSYGTGGQFEFYAPDKDINVVAILRGAKGDDYGSFKGGNGGETRISFTIRKNTEYIVRIPAKHNGTGGNAVYLYEKGSLIAVAGGGGSAGKNGNGGAGGGGNSGGQAGQGPGGGAATSSSLATLGYFCDGNVYCESNQFTATTGGAVSRCPPGGPSCTSSTYWRNNFSPCSDYGVSQARNVNGTIVSGSATISRGFKGGVGHRMNGGYAQASGDGAGGQGTRGGNAATKGTGGGGSGGSGYGGSGTTGANSGSAQIEIRLA